MPPQQFYTIYDELHGRLLAQRAAYDRTTGTGFQALNPRLARSYLKPLSAAALDRIVQTSGHDIADKDANSDDDMF